MPPFMQVPIPQYGCAVIRAERQMKPAMAQDAFDDAEIIEYFQTSGLQALAPGTNGVCRRFVNEPKMHITASEIAGQRKARWTGSDDQNGYFTVRQLHTPRKTT
jgi:hypothetical protein